MTPLRQKMIDAMLLRGFADKTQQLYLQAVKDLTAHSGQSPDSLSMQQIEDWLLSLVKERKLAPSSCRLYFNGVSFLFTQVLKREDFADYGFALPKNRQIIPALLNSQEVATILSQPARLRDRMLLMLCYGCGLRVNELVRIRVEDIDGQQRLLHISQGKGRKDRLLPLGDTLLHLRWVAFSCAVVSVVKKRPCIMPVAIDTVRTVNNRQHKTGAIVRQSTYCP